MDEYTLSGNIQKYIGEKALHIDVNAARAALEKPKGQKANILIIYRMQCLKETQYLFTLYGKFITRRKSNTCTKKHLRNLICFQVSQVKNSIKLYKQELQEHPCLMQLSFPLSTKHRQYLLEQKIL